jgi:hypothetical protein
MQQNELIEQFIASFEKLDEMAEFPETHPLVRQFAVGSPDPYGRLRWRPMKVRTDSSQLTPLLEKLPARFPPLFEQLALLPMGRGRSAIVPLTGQSAGP